jgi:hypothetical protein
MFSTRNNIGQNYVSFMTSDQLAFYPGMSPNVIPSFVSWSSKLTCTRRCLYYSLYIFLYFSILVIQGGSNMTGTSAACLHTNQSRSYLNHLVSTEIP